MGSDINLIECLTTKKDKAIFIWICNIGAEKYWNDINPGIFDRRENIITNKIEEINLLLCRNQDILILREKPSDFFLQALKKFGFSIPKILYPKHNDSLKSISEMILMDEDLQIKLKNISDMYDQVYFVPYAVTILEEEIAKKCNLDLIGPSSSVCKIVNDKIFSRRMAQELGYAICDGKVCRTIEEIRETYFNLVNGDNKYEKVIIKEPYGASGKGLFIIGDKALLESTLGIIKRLNIKGACKEWIVEGWYKKKFDINFQIFISKSGKVNMFSISEQVLNGSIYLGSKINTDAIDNYIKQEYLKYASEIGDYLFKKGCRGIVSIDSIVTDYGTIIPIVEINGRFSLSTYLTYIAKANEENIIHSRYYRVTAIDEVDYSTIYNAIKDEEILFDPIKKEGVIIYSSATLPKKVADSQEILSGRIFTLIVSSKSEMIEQYKMKFEIIMSKIFKSIY